MGRVAGFGRLGLSGGGVNGVLGVDHGDDLVAVQSAGKRVTGGSLIGIALNGRGGLGGHIIGRALLQTVGGVGRGYGVAILVHIADGDGIAENLLHMIGKGGAQEVQALSHDLCTGSHGVEDGAGAGM